MKKKIKGKRIPRFEEVWMNPQGDLLLVDWNLCICHPRDMIVRWGNRMKEGASYSNQHRPAVTRERFRKGFVRLQVVDKSFVKYPVNVN